jgi:DNA-binding NarL/FixJ family response regulator
LHAHGHFNVVATCADAASGLSAVAELEPDVALIDISMPGPSPFDGVRQLVERGIRTRFIFLSAYLSDSYLRDVLKAKASGYLVKTSAIEKIADAVARVHRGEQCFSPEVEDRMARVSRNARGKELRTRGDALTSREIEVLRYVARGFTVRQVAQTMHLSARTVDRHKANIMRKIKIHNQAGLIRYAIAEGLADMNTFLEPTTGGTKPEAS